MPARDTSDELILDLLEWIGPRGRSYAETLDAWKSTCPRLTIWEDANDRGLVVRHRLPEIGPVVSVSSAGIAYLRAHRPSSRTAAANRGKADEVAEDATAQDRTA